MAETLANGTVIPQGADLIHSSGVQADRNMGASIDSQLGNRYTKAQADALLTEKSDTSHTHDSRYYTETEVDGKLSEKVGTSDPRLTDARTPVAHQHPVTDVTGLQAALDQAALTAEWAQLADKPTAFPPVAHTHDDRYYTEAETDTKLSSKVATDDARLTDARTPTAHQHAQGDVNGLDPALASKRNVEAVELDPGADANNFTEPGTYIETYAFEATSNLNFPENADGVLKVEASSTRVRVEQAWRGFASGNRFERSRNSGVWTAWERVVKGTDPRLSDARTPTAHTHTTAQVTGLDAALSAKADKTDPRFTDARTPTAHQHPVGDVSGLEALLAGKSPTSHTHDARYYTQAQIDTRLNAISTAYQVAQMFGFEGTVEQWLDSLVGPQGPEGPYGGTTVTDPQVASYVTSDTATRAALDASYRRGVSAAEYGAKGDGTTDDTLAIQAAIDAAVVFGVDVFIPGGRYLLSGPLDLPSKSAVTLAPDAVIDVSGMGNLTPAFQAIGTIEASKTLTVDAEKGAKILTVESTAGIAAGDWVKVSSQLPWGSTNQPAGEIQRVAAVTDTTITVSEALADTYATPYSAIVEKVNMVEDVKVTGGAIVGNPDTPTILTTGVRLDMVHNASVTGTSMRWVHYCGIFITDSVAVTVHDCSFDESLGLGLGYGIAASWAVQDLAVTACHSTRVRHLLALGGGATRGGIARRVTVTGCTASDCFDAGLDFHPGAEDVTFVGNTISGSQGDGIVAQGGRFVISGNTITGSARHGILVQNQTIRGLEGTISGNTITGSAGSGISIAIYNTPQYRVWSGLSITGNVITDGASYGISIINGDTSFKAEGITLSGNTVRRNASMGIYLRGVKDAAMGSNHVAAAASTTESMYVQQCTDVAISGNVIAGGMRAIRVSASMGVTVTGNRGSGATVGLLTDAASAPVIAMGNSFAGCATRMSLAGTGNVSTTADAAGAYNL